MYKNDVDGCRIADRIISGKVICFIEKSALKRDMSASNYVLLLYFVVSFDAFREVSALESGHTVD